MKIKMIVNLRAQKQTWKTKKVREPVENLPDFLTPYLRVTPYLRSAAYLRLRKAKALKIV